MNSEKNTKKKMNGKKKPYHNRNTSSKYTKDNENFKSKSNLRENAAVDMSTTNDISWYNNDRQLIHDVARIPFSNQLGRPISMLVGTDGKSVPGIYAMFDVLCPGIAEASTDAVNLAANNVFQYIRRNLSTYAQYAPADVMMYILGIDSIYAWYAHLTRIFGVVNNYSGANLYYPDGLLYAMGFNEASRIDLKSNLSAYMARFNNLVYKAASLYMPADFSVIKRHMWLFGNYFMDSESTKAQTYIHIPHGFHILDETTSPEGTMLMYNKLFEEYGNIDTLMSALLEGFDIAIERFRNSDSMSKIAADMKRAYEGKNYFMLSRVDENYQLMPIADHDVLHQIMNAHVQPKYFGQADFNITQSVDKNIILFKPQIVSPTIESAYAKNAWERACSIMETDGIILNYFKRDVGEDDIVESTRSTSMIKYNPGSEAYTLAACGADFIVGAQIIHMDLSATGDFRFKSRDIDSYTTNNLVNNLSDLMALDWHPMALAFGGETSVLPVPMIAFDNYTIMSSNNLKMLHDNIMLSMWQIPGGFTPV